MSEETAKASAEENCERTIVATRSENVDENREKARAAQSGRVGEDC